MSWEEIFIYGEYGKQKAHRLESQARVYIVIETKSGKAKLEVSGLSGGVALEEKWFESVEAAKAAVEARLS